MTKLTDEAAKALSKAIVERNKALAVREAEAEREKNHREHEAYIVDEHIARFGARGYKKPM